MKKEYLLSVMLFIIFIMLLWACQFLENTKASYNELLLIQRRYEASITKIESNLQQLESQKVEITDKMIWVYENRKEFNK
jgi:hypothetical protein